MVLRVCLVLSIVLTLSTLSRADVTLTFLDSTDTIAYSFNGNPPINDAGCPGAENFACIVNDNHPSPSSDLTLSFNIYEQDGVTLSDTLQVVSRVGLGISSVFISDVEGVPLNPLAGGTSIVENGDIQPAATIPLTVGGNYLVQFQSDLDAVPEPRLIVLLTLGVLGIAIAAQRRKLS